MCNHLKMNEETTIEKLKEMGWSNRRIARETGHHRKTIARIVAESSKCTTNPTAGVVHFEGGTRPPGNPAPESAPAAENAPPTRPPGPASKAEPHRTYIEEQVELGVDAQNIFIRLVNWHGFAGSYSSVKRFVRHLRPEEPKPVGRMVCARGEEAQIDFGRGAPVIDPATGDRRLPWVFTMTLGYSRCGYVEAVWDQKVETFIRCHQNAFRFFGGVPLLIRLDNLKAGIIECEWNDFFANPLFQAFAKHSRFAVMPHRPAQPQHKGKVESDVGYVQGALAGLTFTSLEAENEYLEWWTRKVAHNRIHGSTKRQVWQMFVTEEQPKLQALPAEPFEHFREATRTVHRDGFIQLEQNYYAVPPELLGRKVVVRWTGTLVRIYHDGRQVRVHQQSSARGLHIRSTDDHGPPTLTQTGYQHYLERQGAALGGQVGAWVAFMFQSRGLQACRVVQGVLGLRKKHPPAVLDAACGQALAHYAGRYRTIKALCEHQGRPAERPAYTADHEFLRPSADYQRKLFPEDDHDAERTGAAAEAVAITGDAGDGGGAQPGGAGREADLS